MSNIRVDGLAGIKTGTTVANPRQGNEHNGSSPTLRDGDPRADPPLQENLRGPWVATEEMARGRYTS